MHRKSTFAGFILAALSIAIASHTAQAQSVLARAEADPSVMTMGEVSTYSIHFLNTDSVPRLNTPRVDGLEFNQTPSTSTYRRIENGRFSIETTMSWSFRATRLGNFTIPGRSMEIKGELLEIPDVEIRVIEPTEEQKSRALLILELPDGPYYVGQSLQSRLILLGRTDLHLSPVRLPVCENDTFQHSELNNNQQRGSLQYKGRSYNAIVWNMILTPIKAGETELKFSQDLELQTINRDSRFPSIFGMTTTQSEPLTVYTETYNLDIRPLPEPGEEVNFSGAIGQFEVKAEAGSDELTQGEPTSFTLSLSGKGSFERITPPELPQWENWRIYPPKVSFEQQDEIGYQGTKSFEYILIPQAADLSEIPGFKYSVFDPDAGKYVTKEMPAIPITVEASEISAAINTFIPDADGSGLQQRVPEKLLSLRPELGIYFPTGSVLWKELSFWLSNAMAGLVLMVIALWRIRKLRLRTDQRLARRHAGSKEIRKALQSAQHAARDNDASRFFEHCRFAIQESVSHLAAHPVEAKSLVTTDCLRILGKSDVSGETRATAERLLGMADAHQFAGSTPSREDLVSAASHLSKVLYQLNRATK